MPLSFSSWRFLSVCVPRCIIRVVWCVINRILASDGLSHLHSRSSTDWISWPLCVWAYPVSRWCLLQSLNVYISFRWCVCLWVHGVSQQKLWVTLRYTREVSVRRTEGRKRAVVSRGCSWQCYATWSSVEVYRKAPINEGVEITQGRSIREGQLPRQALETLCCRCLIDAVRLMLSNYSYLSMSTVWLYVSPSNLGLGQT